MHYVPVIRSLHWRYNGHDSVSNHQPQDCLLNRLFIYQSSASLVFVWVIHRGPVNSPHKWAVTRKMFPFDDVIMFNGWYGLHTLRSGKMVATLADDILTLKSIPFWSYIKTQPGPFRPGDIYDHSGWKFLAHFGLYHVKKYQTCVCSQRLNPVIAKIQYGRHPWSKGRDFEIQKC